MNKKIIIIKKQIHKESDLIIKGLGANGSKVVFIAKSAIKSIRRFGPGTLEVTNYVEVTYNENHPYSKTSNLFLINEAILLKTFDKIKQTYQHLNLTYYFLDIIEKVTQEGNTHCNDLFNLLGNSLQSIEKIKDIEKLSILKLHFEIRLLYFLGYLKPDENNRIFLDYPINQNDLLIKKQEDNLISNKSFSNKSLSNKPLFNKFLLNNYIKNTFQDLEIISKIEHKECREDLGYLNQNNQQET